MRKDINNLHEEMYSIVEIPTFTVVENRNTKLSVAERNFNPLNVKRFFTLESENQETRGFHAHKVCQQTIICTLGSATVICRDGVISQEFQLRTDSSPFIIPPGIWTEIELNISSRLIILASEYYDESDYIRDWDTFMEFRRAL